MADRGNLYVIAAPSGTGKTTLVKALVSSLKNIIVSISHTTRGKRPDEVNGVNYYFIPTSEFENLIAQGDFLEHATIFGNYYGTSKRWVEDTLAEGTDVILEIDWQGHDQIKRLFPSSIGVFIIPPTLQDLRERLIKRDQDHPEIITERLADAKETVKHWVDFNYLVVNDDFNHALQDLIAIIKAERLKTKRQGKKYSSLISALTQPSLD